MNKRDQLEQLLGQFYYSYTIIRDKEQKRRRAINYLCGVTMIFFLLGMLLIKLAYGPAIKSREAWTHMVLNPYVPVAAFVIWFGFIGGFTSVLVRLVNIPTKNDETTLVADLETVIFTLYSGPVLGAIFALVLYFVCAAKLVTGDVFPQFYSSAYYGKRLSQTSENSSSTPALAPENDAQRRHAITQENYTDTIRTDLLQLTPLDPQNLAILLVWSFIAGYSQTLVPDKLKAISTPKKGAS